MDKKMDDDKNNNMFISKISNELLKIENTLKITDKLLGVDKYKNETVKIGTQEWMIENLNAEYYLNGDHIPQVENNESWEKLTIGAWCYQNNDKRFGEKHGKIYNWYAINDKRGLIPNGFNLPSVEDWETLKDFIKSNDDPSINDLKNGWGATNLKSKFGWQNTIGKDTFGFNAYPCGIREKDGNFRNNIVGFWSDSVDENGAPYYIFIHDIANLVFITRGDSYKNNGFYIRCLRTIHK